jgi:hypothetical protein
MKRNVQILLLAVCLIPLGGLAREETPEERKQRIMRKYLRERTSVVLSDLFVPEESADEADIADSEKYQEPQVEFERQGPGAMPPPHMPRRPIPRAAEDSNWLLAEEPDSGDPYGESSMDRKGAELEAWTSWDFRDDPATRDGSLENYRNPDALEVGSRRSRRPSLLNMRAPESAAPNGQGFQRGRPSTGQDTGIFGRQPGTRSIFGETSPFQKTPTKDQPAVPTFATPRPGSLTQPGRTDRRKFGSDHRTFGSDARKEQQPGFSTYRNPYEDRQGTMGQPGTMQGQQQEYKREDPYQKWKSKRQEWDPTKDDAYLNELMQNNRR